MIDKIIKLLSEIDNLKANSPEEYEALRIKYLSKKGVISSLMSEFRDVPPEQKKEVGKKLNILKKAFEDRISELKRELENAQEDSTEYDLSRTSYPITLGTRHPISLVKEEICNIFNRLGFSIAEGPEIEDDWHVFSSLNFADDHPARDMQDTFFIPYPPIPSTGLIIISFLLTINLLNSSLLKFGLRYSLLRYFLK